ncbi:MAG: BACON domain-containing protein [Spirosomataceae bacterium]
MKTCNFQKSTFFLLFFVNLLKFEISFSQSSCNGCVGYLDGAWCPTAGGWSKNASGGQQNVDIYIDGQLVETNFTPNFNRNDLGGMFGFVYDYPICKRDGQNHTINVKFAGTSQDLQGSPKTFNCSGGGGSCNSSLTLSTSNLSFTSGSSSQSLNVNASSTNWSATTADSWITISPSSGNNTTSVNITVQSNGGASRTGTVTFSGTGGVSNQTLTLTQGGTSNTCNGCVGYLDGAWCPTAGGWSKNASGGQQNVDVYIDGQLVQSNFSPNYNRSDVGGMFGFNYTYPNNKLDGQNHTINVKFAGTSQDLQGSPKTFNCSGGGGNNSRTSHWGTTFTEPTNWFNSQSDAYPTMIETYQNQLNQSSNQGDAIFWFYGLSNGQSYPTGPWKSMGNGYVTITLPTHSVSYITSQISKIEMELIHKATNTSVFYLYDTKGGIQGVRGNNHTKESHRWLPSGDYKVKFKNLTNNLNIRVIFQAVRQEVEGNAPTNFNEILPPLQTREFDISMPLRLDDMGDMYKMNCNAMSDDNPGFNMRIDNSSEIEVYPNPTSEKITIDLSNEDSGNVKVILSDPNGNIFKNLDFTISDNNKVLNLSPEFKEKGIYTIKIITNAKTFSKKLYFEN